MSEDITPARNPKQDFFCLEGGIWEETFEEASTRSRLEQRLWRGILDDSVKTWDHLRSYGIIYLRSSGSVLDHLRAFEIIWTHLGSSRIIWHHVNHSGSFRIISETRIIWDHLRSSAIIRDHITVKVLQAKAV